MTDIFIRALDTHSKNHKGRVYVYKLHSSHIRELNETATFIWNKLKNAASEESIVRTMSHTYNAKPAEIRRDVHDFLVSYLKDGLICRVIKPSR